MELEFDCLVGFRDGQSAMLDMDVPGWRDALMSYPVGVVSLLPKDGIAPRRSPVHVQLPEGTSPVVFMRVKASTAGAFLRMYGIGYTDGMARTLLWVLPDGTVEVGEDSPVADEMLEAQNVVLMGG